jgi:cytochrome c553
MKHPLKAIVAAIVASLAAVHAMSAAAAGDAVAGAEKGKTCAACHGPEGNSAVPMYPSLAGQVPGYIAKQLGMFKSGARESAVMKGMSDPLSEQDMSDLDAYYTKQVANIGAVPDEERDLATEGQKLYRGGYAPFQISACMSCHGPSGHGVPPQYPRVAGQTRSYLEAEMLKFKSGKRKSQGDIMTSIAFRMSEQQIKAVSAYMHAIK